MNLQFHLGRLRVRLEAMELDQLLLGQPLHLTLGPNAALGQCVLRSAAIVGAQFIAHGCELQLALPHQELAALKSRLPSKTGLSWSLDAETAFELVLEVDLRKR